MSKDKANLIDLLEKMLKYNPTERITAKDALDHPYFDDIKAGIDKTVKKWENIFSGRKRAKIYFLAVEIYDYFAKMYL